MKRAVLATLRRLGCAAFAMAAASVQASGAPAPPARVAALAGRVMTAVASEAGFNGAVVLMRDGQVVYERGVGLAARKPDRPFTPDTPSDGGSLAKTLTAAALWELVAEGRLSYDDPVTRHLPAYPYPQHTLRDLATHRNGLPDYGFFDPDFKPGQPRDTADLLAVLARRKPVPGTEPRVEYSNLGFDVAALVIERSTGMRIERWWRERYLQPLGLDKLFARPARLADWPVPRTPGYQRKGNDWVPNDAFDGEAFIGASNVIASARDWARWGDAFARARVMAAERLDAGLRQPMLDSGMDNRLTMLSWYCDDGARRCHYTGSNNGFYAQVWWDRSARTTIAYVSNSTLPPWRCARLTRDLIDALDGREATADAVQPMAVPRAELPRRAGRYASSTMGEITLTARGGRLAVRIGNGEAASVFALPGGAYYAPTLDLWLAFGGPPQAPTLHLRTVFHEAEARRADAPAGKS